MKQTTVEVPATTLNALKKLVFDGQGVDLSPIIDDLAFGMGEDKRDLIAINIALTMKGLVPDVNIPAVSFEAQYKGISVFIYKGFSLIRNIACFTRVNISYRNSVWKLSNTEEERYDLSCIPSLSLVEAIQGMSGVDEDKSNLPLETLYPILNEITPHP